MFFGMITLAANRGTIEMAEDGGWGGEQREEYTDRTFKVIVAWIVSSDSRDEEKAAVFQGFLNFRVL